MYGYMGKLLMVDLSSHTTIDVPLDEDVARNYIGGSGLSARILYDEIGTNIDPLAPDNILVFATGPFQATGIPFSGRFSVCTRSPLTGGWAEANSGGWFGPFLKRTGYDALIIKGKSLKPVYIVITDSGMEFKDASHLWGKDSFETETEIKKEVPIKDIKVACIGQAGENLVRFASVMNDMGRAAGRSGVGAVMGSKNLKAVAVSGKKSIQIADKEKLSQLIRGLKLGKNGPVSLMFAKYGTPLITDMFEPIGDVPFKYWTRADTGRNSETAKVARKIGGGSMYKNILTKNYHCYACPLGCGRIVKVTSPKKYAVEGHGPEQETSVALGTLCMVDDLAAIAKANDICNRYGMDTIETGNLVAFAMSCYEHGWITKADTDGIPLNFGNADAMVSTVYKIGIREGFGDLLAEGLLPAAEKIGNNSIGIVMHSKGQAFPMHDPRAFPGLALSFGTSERGACHLHGIGWAEACGLGYSPFHIGGQEVKKYSLEGHPLNTKVSQDIADVADALIQCKFTLMALVSFGTQASLLSALTGWSIDSDELLKTGERMFTLKRLFNCRLGVRRKDDVIPEMVPVPMTRGYVPKGESLQKALDEYYAIRGWNEDGVPTEAKIEQLGIENVAVPESYD